MKGRTLLHHARHGHGSAHDFREAFDDGKSQAGALFFLFTMRAGLDERFENRVQFVLRNAHAGVLNLDDERDVAAGLLFFPSDAHFDAAFVGELDRVADEIDQNLPQPDAVNQHRVRKILGDMTFQFEFFFGRRFGKQRVDEIANLAQVGRFGTQFHHARLDF